MSTAISVSAAERATMRPPGGPRVFKPRSRYGLFGIGVMVFAHVLLGWLLVSGLARQAFEIVKKPLEATIVQEVKLPPPPPPPPPKLEKVVRDLPKTAEPPPAYVPPPEIAQPAPAAAPTITSVQSNEAVALPPAAPAPVSQPAAPVQPAGPVKTDIAVACPKQVAPEVPAKAIDEGISGTVKAELRIRGGKVVSANILSGPKIFHAAVRAAVARYVCAADDAEAIAVQEFTFKVE